MTGDRGSSVPKLQVIQGLTWIGWHLLLSREQDTQLPSTRVKSVCTCLQGGYLGNPCNKSATGLPSHCDLVLVSHRLLNISNFFSIFPNRIKNIEKPFPTKYLSVKVVKQFFPCSDGYYYWKVRISHELFDFSMVRVEKSKMYFQPNRNKHTVPSVFALFCYRWLFANLAISNSSKWSP